MTLPLRARLFVLHGMVVAVALALVTALAIREQRGWLLERHLESLERAAIRAAAALPAQAAGALRAQAAGAPAGLPDLADTLGALLGARVTLIDSVGRVVGDSEVPRAALEQVENHGDRPEVRAALAGRAGRAVRRSHTIGADLLYVAVPVRGVAGVAAARLAEPVRVVADLELSLVRIALAAAALALLFSVPLVLWVGARHVARLTALERAASRLAAGDASARARERPDDEIGRLGHAINAMAAERRERLETLGRERDERETMLAHLNDGVALIGGDDRIARMNRALAEMLGQPLPAPPGTPLAEYARAPELDDVLARARAQGRSVEADLRLWSARPRSVHASIAPLEAGGSGAVLIVVHDLSAAEALTRVRQDFVANAAHELRTPLTSLRGYAETLLDGGLDDREHREGFVRVIRDQALRLEALVADLLSLAELERPGAGLRLEPFDLREVAEHVARSLRARAEEGGLVLEVEPGGPVPVHADRARLEQVLANLVDNAVKYTERGRVDVRVGGDALRAWYEVEDTGPGIPDEDQSRVFERFYRVERARAREKGGTGLGLSIVKHIAALHGGAVSVQSRVGQGTTFRFEIPRGIPAAPAPRG